MQETMRIDPDDERNNRIRQAIFSGATDAEIRSKMDADVRQGETVLRRRRLSEEEMRGMNRHQRRKAAALARRGR